MQNDLNFEERPWCKTAIITKINPTPTLQPHPPSPHPHHRTTHPHHPPPTNPTYYIALIIIKTTHKSNSLQINLFIRFIIFNNMPLQLFTLHIWYFQTYSISEVFINYNPVTLETSFTKRDQQSNILTAGIRAWIIDHMYIIQIDVISRLCPTFNSCLIKVVSHYISY